MSVLALLPYPVGWAPGQRYRIEQWRPFLEREGIRIRPSCFFSLQTWRHLYRPGSITLKAAGTLAGYCRRVRDALRAADFDVVFVYREGLPLLTPWFERLLVSDTPAVVDFDDAIYLSDASFANRWTRFLKHPGKIAALCDHAAEVTVGNDVLANFASRHCPRVTVIPSTIDFDAYGVGARPPNPPNPRPIVGWTGSETTGAYLLAILPALRELRASVDFQFLVIGPHLPLDGLDHRWIPWTAATEARDLGPVDIGVMPLPDDEWSRGKCGLKALQFMALGIPPVVSPVGANCKIVLHGVNGFHANTPAEWVHFLRILLLNGSVRTEMGQRARRTVECGYAASVQAPRLAAVLRRAARR